MRPVDKIMIVGCGELCGILLEYLCRYPNIGEIVVADINEDKIRRKVNSAIHGASFLDLYPKITYRVVDLLNVEKTAEIIREINPCIIVNGSTLQSWWVVNELPPDVNAKLYRHKVGLGAWTAMHLPLMSKLMQAVTKSGIDTHVVNSAFPDVTNVSLARVGMAPTIGIGNACLVVPYIRKAAAEQLNIPMRNIKVEFIGHHYHCYNWARAGKGTDAPFYLRVYDGCTDITERLGSMTDFVGSLPKHGARPGGRGGQYVVAASIFRNVLDIFFDTHALGMSPAPKGLEGAYPVRLSRAGAEVVLPAGMTLEEARGLMLQAQQYDGIEEIRANGDVKLTPEAGAMLHEELHVEWDVVTIQDSLEQAHELRAKFLEFLKRHNVEVPM